MFRLCMTCMQGILNGYSVYMYIYIYILYYNNCLLTDNDYYVSCICSKLASYAL